MESMPRSLHSHRYRVTDAVGFAEVWEGLRGGLAPGRLSGFGLPEHIGSEASNGL